MTKKFLALAKANIQDIIPIKDDLIEARIDPVYQRGLEFTGEVLIAGTINDDKDEIDTGTLSALLQDYLSEHVELSRMIKVEFVDGHEKERNTYKKAV